MCTSTLDSRICPQAKQKAGAAKEVALQEARSAAARSFEALERVKERALPVRRNPSPAASPTISRVRVCTHSEL